MEVMVFAEISQMTQAAIEEFESAVVQFDEILEARRMFGTPDYLLRVTVPQSPRVRSVRDDKAEHCAPYHPGGLPPNHEGSQAWLIGASSRIRTCDMVTAAPSRHGHGLIT
jgi:DNA-binding Lrp family transcriptional regulator